MTTLNICIWGDSITYGAWDAGGGWADRLRRYLHEQTLASSFSRYYWVYNLGIPGDTTRDVLNHFDAECAARNPDLILFALGVNDASVMPGEQGPRVPLDEFTANTGELVARAKACSPHVFWVGLTPVVEEVWKKHASETDALFENARIAEYRRALSDMARHLGVPVIDVDDLLTSEDLIDGLHPNSRGHEKIFLRVKNFLATHEVF